LPVFISADGHLSVIACLKFLAAILANVVADLLVEGNKLIKKQCS